MQSERFRIVASLDRIREDLLHEDHREHSLVFARRHTVIRLHSKCALRNLLFRRMPRVRLGPFRVAPWGDLQ